MKKIAKLQKPFIMVFAMAVLMVVCQLAGTLTTLANAFSASVGNVVDGTNYVGREFNSKYDTSMDSFSGTELNGYADGGHTFYNKSFLDVALNGTNNNTDDNSAYKVRHTSNDEGKMLGLVFYMAIHPNLKLEDLTLGLRYTGDEVMDFNFGDLVSPESTQLKDISVTDNVLNPTRVAIDFALSFEGEEFPNGAAVLSGFLAIHLKANTYSVPQGQDAYKFIRITEIAWLSNDDTEETIDNFENRKNVYDSSETVAWRNSHTGFIQNRTLMLEDNSFYQVARPKNTSFSSVVITAKTYQSGSSLSVQPLTGDPQKNNGDDADWSDIQPTIAWNNLVATGTKYGKMPAISSANAGTGYVIDLLESFGRTDIAGFKITSTGNVFISNIFWTNLEVVTPFDQPILDSSDYVSFDNFNREAAYVFSTGEESQAIPETERMGFEYIISTGGKDNITVENGKLVLDATSYNGLINYRALAIDDSGRNSKSNYDYMVLKMKAEGEVSLNDFRLATFSDAKIPPPVYANGQAGQLMSNQGLPLRSFGHADNKYITKDGFTYFVIDLALSGLIRDINGIDLWFTNAGSGKLLIDEILFANELQPSVDETSISDFMSFDNEKVFSKPIVWAHTFGKTTEWEFEKTNKLAEGITAENNSLVYNMEESWAEKYSIKFAVAGDNNNNVGKKRDFIVLRMKGSQGLDLSSFGIKFILWENGEKEVDVWQQQNKFLGLNGKAISSDVLSTEFTDIAIDLRAINAVNITGIQIYMGGGVTGTFTLNSIYFANSQPLGNLYASVLNGLDRTAPTINITAPATANVGDNVAVSAFASEDVCDKFNMSLSVKRGETVVAIVGGKTEASYGKLNFTDGKFVATEAGTYIVTVTVTDENGNTDSADHSIVVTGTTIVPPEDKPTDNPTEQNPADKKGCGANNTVAFSGILLLLLLAFVKFGKFKKS